MLISNRLAAAVLLPVLVAVGCVRPIPQPSNASLETAEPSHSAPTDTFDVAADGEVGEVTKVKVTTDAGEFIIEVHPEWAPIGAPHWLKLVKEGYYDDTRFFRVVPGFMAQTGISGDPEMNKKWGEATVKDDRVKASNKRGYVTFAQTGMPHSRSTQWFINFGDNSFLDTSGQGFMPFGKVVEGMSVVDKIDPKHGENPDQFRAKAEGNKYLDESFPGLTKIIKIEILDGGTARAQSPDEAATSKEPAKSEVEADKPAAEEAAEAAPTEAATETEVSGDGESAPE